MLAVSEWHGLGSQVEKAPMIAGVSFIGRTVSRVAVK